MSDLRELYQEVIIDHSKNPRNFGALEGASHRALGQNPLCGDELVLQLKLDDDGRVECVRFHGRGCAISTASASLLTEIVSGKTPEEAEAIFELFHRTVTAGIDEEVDSEALGKLAVLAGVREFPMRVKCASLAWHTLRAALAGNDETVTTE